MTIRQAEKHSGLYYLSLPGLVPASPFVFAANKTNMWHSHLGHLSGPRLSDVAALDHHVTNDHVLPCDYCHFSKQKKLVFPVSTSVSTCVLI